jgi:hypothetical protein
VNVVVSTVVVTDSVTVSEVTVTVSVEGVILSRLSHYKSRNGWRTYVAVTVATVVVGLTVATVVVTVDVLAVLVDVILGRGYVLEQKVSAGSYLVRMAAAMAGMPPLQKGFAFPYPAAAMGAITARMPQVSGFAPSMTRKVTIKVVIKVSSVINDDGCCNTYRRRMYQTLILLISIPSS